MLLSFRHQHKYLVSGRADILLEIRCLICECGCLCISSLSTISGLSRGDVFARPLSHIPLRWVFSLLRPCKQNVPVSSHLWVLYYEYRLNTQQKVLATLWQHWLMANLWQHCVHVCLLYHISLTIWPRDDTGLNTREIYPAVSLIDDIKLHYVILYISLLDSLSVHQQNFINNWLDKSWALSGLNYLAFNVEMFADTCVAYLV